MHSMYSFPHPLKYCRKLLLILYAVSSIRERILYCRKVIPKSLRFFAQSRLYMLESRVVLPISTQNRHHVEIPSVEKGCRSHILGRSASLALLFFKD